MSAVAVAVAGAGLIGAGIQAGAAQDAANTQAGALNNSLQMQQRMYNTTLGNEQPFVQGGQQALSQLNYLMGSGQQSDYANQNGGAGPNTSAGGFGSLNSPFTIDKFHQMSPGYQFAMQQGGQGVLNQDASSQGALSGSAMKDLISFNSNYANQSFNNAFNQYQQQQGNTYNRLMGVAQLGQAAGTNSASGGSAYAGNIGQTASNIGTAQAAGQIGVANALTGGVNALSSIPWLMNRSPGTGSQYGTPNTSAATQMDVGLPTTWNSALAPAPSSGGGG